MTPELEFRGDLAAAMVGAWLMTWHEDREINPGVPDVSYVMAGGKYETGWLELKATRVKSGPILFKVEASQHRWIDAHHHKVPVHFLLAGPMTVWLVGGAHHRRLASALSADDLDGIGTPIRRDMLRRQLPALLKSATFRGRDGI